MKNKNVWVIGDVHGDWFVIRNFYERHKDELSPHYRDNILIILGDFGANYYLNEKDDYFKEIISKFPFMYFVIRGNHEERPSIIAAKFPSKWRKQIFFGNIVWVEKNFPQIFYALDEGGEYTIDKKSVLVIPGAYSVDKNYRIMNHYSWFPNEQLSDLERADILNNLKPHYDIILSHTCPYSWQTYISDLFLSQVDQSLVDSTMEQFLDQVVQLTTWDRYYFGHYHDDRDIPTKATMLFHEGIPFGKSYSSYFNSQLIF